MMDATWFERKPTHRPVDPELVRLAGESEDAWAEYNRKADERQAAMLLGADLPDFADELLKAEAADLAYRARWQELDVEASVDLDLSQIQEIEF